MVLVKLLKSDVELKDGQSVIPAEDIAKISDINSLREELIKEADQLKEDLKNKAAEEEKKAVEKGYQEGLEKWGKQLFDLEEEVTKIKQEHEKTVVDLSLIIAKKIVQHDIKVSKKTLNEMVTASLETVKQDADILIYCNEKDYEKIAASKASFMEIFEKLNTLTIQVKDDVDEGGYIIKTERGIINNAQFDRLWETLEKNIKRMIADDK